MSILQPTDDPDVFINTKTNRKVKKNSQQYNKIVAQEKETNETNNLDDKIKEKTKKVLKSIIKDNKKELDRVVDPETELKRLLYDKLCLADRKKKKIKYLLSSSSESSDSD